MLCLCHTLCSVITCLAVYCVHQELIPVLLSVIASHPDSKIRDQLLHIMFNLIKRPDKHQRYVYMNSPRASTTRVCRKRTHRTHSNNRTTYKSQLAPGLQSKNWRPIHVCACIYNSCRYVRDQLINLASLAFRRF